MKIANTNQAIDISPVSELRDTAVTSAKRRVRQPDLSANISQGDLTPNTDTEVATLMAEVNRLKQELVSSQQKVEELEFIADEDPLVNVLNRRAFDRELKRALAFARRYDMNASFVFIDLNDFKRVNDDFGHAAGDAVLKYVAAILGENVRESDVVGRLGGDEFGVILVQIDEEVAAIKTADIAARISATPVSFEGVQISVSASVGHAMFGKDDDIESLVARADKAMYENKMSFKL